MRTVSSATRQIMPALGALLAAACLAACTPPKPSPLLALRPNLGAVAIAGLPGATPYLSATAAKGSGEAARQGAGAGLKLGGIIAIAGGTGGDARLLLISVPVGAAVALVGTPLGAVMGAANARSKAEVEAAEAVIHTALAAMDPHPRLAEAIRNQPLLVTYLKAHEPAASRHGIGTIVEVGVTRYGLTKVGLAVTDPDFRLYVEARLRLVRAGDNAELYLRAWRYEGATHAFFRWADGEGALLRAELERAYRELAERIVRHLLADPDPPQSQVIAVRGRALAP
jgi:hypothetical protein